MNVPSVIAIASATLAVAAGFVARRISGAPGSGDLRWFALVCFASAGYALANLGTTLRLAPGTVRVLSHLQVAVLAVHLWAWLRASLVLLDRRPTWLDRASSAAVLVTGALVLVPGVFFSDRVMDRPFEPFGAVYRLVELAPAGNLMMALLYAIALGVLLRFVRAWRAGVPHAGVLAAALGVLVALSANDALATAGLPFPFVLDWGFAAPVLAVGWMFTARFVDAARDLDRLRRDLAAQVEGRTRELGAALESLHQAEKLAAIGQFASGVAHEVNNPAAAVTSGLRYLTDPDLPHTPEAREAAGDALRSMERINALVRRLVDAGRLAELPARAESAAAAEVAPAVAEAVRALGPALPAGVRVEQAVPPGLAVRMRREALDQVLLALLRNASEAVPAGRAGRMRVAADAEGAAVRIQVEDDGAGMSAEVLRRAFDPFFTTKPERSGLSLSVARGLVESAGGVIWLESVEGRGTTARLELSLATAQEPSAGPLA